VSESDFVKELDNHDQAWIVSGNTAPPPSLNFANAIKEYNMSGRGVCLWTDNVPYVETAAEWAKQIFECTFVGDYGGGKNLVLGDAKTKGQFGRHLLTSGVTSLFEGLTISHPTNTAKMEVLACATDGNPCIAFVDYPSIPDKQGRIVIDCGCTKLYNQWDTAGTARYVRNVAVWLLGLDHRMKIAAPLQGKL